MLLRAAGGGGSSFPAPPATLGPSSTIGISRSGSNPTFNFNSLAENMILVGSTYWAVYQPGQEGDIALASSASPDGPWTSQGTVIHVSKIYAPYLIEDGGTFYIFFGDDKGVGGDGKMYYATASTVNGTYTIAGSPTAILSPGATGAWDDYRVGEPSILKSGSTFYMLYMGEKTAFQTSERIGLATAPALTGPWTKDGGNPVLSPDTSGAWDDFIVADPDMFAYGGLLWMLYSSTPSGGGTPWGLGLAYATAPMGPWTRHMSNPIMNGSGIGFDENGSFRGCVFTDNDGFHVVYTGLPSGSPNLATMKGGNAMLVVS